MKQVIILMFILVAFMLFTQVLIYLRLNKFVYITRRVNKRMIKGQAEINDKLRTISTPEVKIDPIAIANGFYAETNPDTYTIDTCNDGNFVRKILSKQEDKPC